MKTYTYDIETYSNYTLFALRDIDSHELITFEIKGKTNSLSDKDINKLKALLINNKIITYNGMKFDEPITAYALKGATSKQMYDSAQALIVDKLGVYNFYRNIRAKKFITNHIDIMDVARGSASLKLYGARLGTKKLQDLPYEPETKLTKKEMTEVLNYCENDNILTDELFRYLKTDIELREGITAQYNINVMSDNGAKIAEKILVHMTGYEGKAPSIPEKVVYTPPKYIKFKTPELKKLFKQIKKHKFLIMNNDIITQLRRYKYEDEYTFLLDDLGLKKSTKERFGTKSKKTVTNSGNIISPDFLDKPITIDGVPHKLGLGGVHGSIEGTTITPDDDELIVDIDYKSLYPSLKIQNGFIPSHIGVKYLEAYKGMYHTRNNVLKPAMKELEYGSEEYNKLDREQDVMKLVLNSSFGKEGEKYSKVYDPSSLLHTTLTGQLTLMMVIEKLSLKGYKTFYANTDGITLKINKKDLDVVQKITTKFDKKTGLEMEYNYFTSSHIRDVNNFVNITSDGKVKSKGAFGEPSIEKNSQTPIVFEAIRKYLLDGTSIRKTIKDCDDVNKFCSSRSVTGGAMFATSIPEMTPEGWDESLARNKRVTKKMIDLKSKLEAVWVKSNGGYLGKVVRWYYATDGSTIHYKKSGNKVPMTDGCRPLMDLPKKNKIPKDLDYNWYYDYAYRMLEDLGVNYE